MIAERTPECPKCSRGMEAGYVLDQVHGGYAQNSWVEGPPEKSFWLGLKVAGHQRLPVTTFRCSRCGYLESYARPAVQGS